MFKTSCFKISSHSKGSDRQEERFEEQLLFIEFLIKK